MNTHFCGSSEHDVSRRAFLRTLSAGTGLAASGIGAVHSFATPSLNDTLKASGKSVILLFAPVEAALLSAGAQQISKRRACCAGISEPAAHERKTSQN